MENKQLLYKNKYIPTDVFKGSNNIGIQEQFKKYYKDRTSETEKQKLVQYLENNPKNDMLGKIPQHILTQEDYKFRKFLNNDLMSSNKVDFETFTDVDLSETKTTETNDFRYIKPVRSLIHIDSRDRDKSLYPKPNYYKIQLKQTYSNIKRISLRSTEFPNSTQLIRDTPLQQANNNIHWQDDDDSTTIFNAIITPGNYEPSGLATEIENKMNAILRDDGDPHNFSVTIDEVTDIVSISSHKIVSANNVLNVNTGMQGIVTVDLTPNVHGFNTGDYIDISGAFTVDGILPSELNGSKIITVINVNEFTYQLSSGIIITNTVNNAGGTIEMAKGVDFKLFFDPNDFSNTIGDILGFPAVNTLFSSIHLNTIIKEAFSIANIYPIGTNFTAITLSKPHNLIQSTEIRFENINEFSSPINNLFGEGIGYLLIPLTPTDITLLQSLYNFDTSLVENSFKISIDSSGEQYHNLAFNIDINNNIPIANDFIAIGIDPVYPVITGFYPYIESATNYIAVELDGDHGLSNGDSVIISELSPSVPYTINLLTPADITELQLSIDPNYDIFDVLTTFDNYFKISTTGSFERFYRPINSELLEFKPYPSGYTGSIPIGSRFNLPNVYMTSFSETHTDIGYPLVALTIDDIAYLEALKLETPSLNIDVNFKIQVTEDNVNIGTSGSIYNGQYVYTRTNNKPVVLSGDNYIFMTSPQIESMSNTGSVTNIFAKLQLASSPGTVIFNSFISNPVVYENSPLPYINELEISYRDYNNVLVNFNDLDHSFCIEIVEYHDKLRYNDFDSRRGRYDDIRVRQNYYS